MKTSLFVSASSLPANSFFHEEAAPDRREHHGAHVGVLARRRQQEGQPALEPLVAEQHDGVPERAHLHAQAEGRRIHVAQQLEGQRGVALEGGFELLDGLGVVDLADQLGDHLDIGLGSRARALGGGSAGFVLDRPADHRMGAGGEARFHVGHAVHARMDHGDGAGGAGRSGRGGGSAPVVGEIDHRVPEAGQHLARQLGVGPALEQQHVAALVQGDQGFAVGRVCGHEVGHLEHEVGRRCRTQQIAQQALADHVERHLPARGRPHVTDRVQQLGDVERRVGLEGKDAQPRGRDAAVFEDEWRVGERHLAQDRNVKQGHLSRIQPPSPGGRTGALAVEVLEQRQALHHRIRLERCIVAALLVLEVGNGVHHVHIFGI